MRQRWFVFPLLVAFGVAAFGAVPQTAAAQAAGEWRTDGIQRVRPEGPQRVKSSEGTLVLDGARRHIVFAQRAEAVFVIPYDRLSAIHFEDTRYPGGRTKRYITLHHATDTGETAVEVIRVRADDRARALVANLEEQTGLHVGQSLEHQSMLGIPIHAAVGAKVTVTASDGSITKGVIRRLTPSAVDIESMSAGTRTFTVANLRRMRYQYDAGRQAKIGVVIGAAAGAFVGFMGSAFCEDNPSNGLGCTLSGVALGMGIVGGATAGVLVLEEALHYPSNRNYDVYRSPLLQLRHGRLGLSPDVTRRRAAVQVSLRY